MYKRQPEHSGLPLYQQLYQALRREIQTGGISAGQKLPSKRKLAEQLNVSVNTVDSAYTQLEAEGFVQSSPRRGFFVLETGWLPQAAALVVPAPQTVPEPSAYRVDFSPWGMARDQFPFGVWRRLMKQCFNEYDPTLLLRTAPQGDIGLRRAVADYLYRARGVSCTPEQVVIGAGTDNLLLMLSYIFPEETALAVENPLYNQAHRLFARMGHRLYTVPVTSEGIDIGQLPQEDHVIFFTTPYHPYPMGYAMPI